MWLPLVGSNPTRFVRREGDDDDANWEHRLAKQYYDRLYKEYCLADLKRYKHGQVGAVGTVGQRRRVTVTWSLRAGLTGPARPYRSACAGA